MPRSWKWLVTYADGSCREVYATSKAGALATGRYAARTTGLRGKATRACHALMIHPVGSQHDGEDSPPDETPPTYLDAPW